MKEELLPQLEQIMKRSYDILDLTEHYKTKNGIQINQDSRILITIVKDMMRILEDD